MTGCLDLWFSSFAMLLWSSWRSHSFVLFGISCPWKTSGFFLNENHVFVSNDITFYEVNLIWIPKKTPTSSYLCHPSPAVFRYPEPCLKLDLDWCQLIPVSQFRHAAGLEKLAQLASGLVVFAAFHPSCWMICCFRAHGFWYESFLPVRYHDLNIKQWRDMTAMWKPRNVETSVKISRLPNDFLAKSAAFACKIFF